MIYYIHENIIKDALYNKKKDKLINKINEAYKQLKDIFTKMKQVSLILETSSNRYKFTDTNDSNYHIINNLLTKIYNYIDEIDKKYKNDSDLLKLKKNVLDYLSSISRRSNANDKFSSSEIKMISDAMKDIVEKYNGPLREKAIKNIESSYDGDEFRFIKFICMKAKESNDSNQLFRVVPSSASEEYKLACINVMQDMADDLYDKIKNNIKNINCDVWDSEDETELLVGCIKHG